MVKRKVLIARQVLVAMQGSALRIASWFTGSAMICGGPGGSSSTNHCARL